MEASGRVVVTGLGAVTPLGNDLASTWSAAISGTSGAGPITLFDASEYGTRIACEVKNWDPSPYLEHKEIRHTDRVVQFAIGAAKQALSDSGLAIDDTNCHDIGVLVGTGVGGIGTLSDQLKVLFERGPSRVSPFLIPMFISNMTSGHVSMVLGARGPNFTVVSACSTSAHAVGEAAEIIKRGDAAVMFAGGAEAAIVPIGVAGFVAEKAMSTRNDDPTAASRPFDLGRDGFVMGEGAAMLVLEDLAHARARGAHIYGEVRGYGATADAYHFTAPLTDGAVQAMRRALARARLDPSDVDYLNAHGTSTDIGDKSETLAIHTVFGEHARKLAVSSTKSMHGHLLGAAGALETVLCLMAMDQQVIPPTINYTEPDPECDLDYVPNTARQAKVSVTMNNAFGFGGHNSSLILQRVVN
ncbi:MAG TPA: beta-ketoacyl-ACP synthase II [Chloroflexota bacterium]|nr:beta-ketoacyl-ACP synthase II [Chloroflexota bacterium]